MKKRTCLAISCLFLAGLGAYIYCTPFISLYQLYQAIAKHNRTEIEAGVDFDSLKDNIKPQVRTKVSDGLEKSLGGKNFISSSITNLSMAFASPVVDHKVDEAISPEGIQKLLADVQKPNGNKDDFDAIEQLKRIKFGYKNLNQFNLQLLDPSSKRPISITMKRHQLLGWKITAIKLP